ncbi:MAG: hypothetical protein HOP28_10800, partial [Gemmatimonadales bacterium]|nr:hypothetical protein [Gemmatimonadales bacterium]
MRNTERALADVASPLRSRLVWLAGAGALSALALVLTLAAWGARAGLLRSPIWVPAAWFMAFAVSGVAAAFGGRAVRRLSAVRLAGRLEREADWRAGSLLAFLEPAAAGTSGSLHAFAAERAAREVADRGPPALR